MAALEPRFQFRISITGAIVLIIVTARGAGFSTRRTAVRLLGLAIEARGINYLTPWQSLPAVRSPSGTSSAIARQEVAIPGHQEEGSTVYAMGS